MNELTLYPQELAEMSVNQLAALSPQQLQEAQHHLNELIAWTKPIRARLDAALEQRYGEPGRAALRESGRDTGTVHLTDGAVAVTVEIPKRVSWDQEQLAVIAERIAATGGHPEDYLDVEFSIPETRFKGWKPPLQRQFAAARTVTPGKPTFRLTLEDTNL